MTPEFIRIPAAAQRFGMSRATIYRRIDDGTLTRFRSGGMVWVLVGEIVAMITGQKQPHPPGGESGGDDQNHTRQRADNKSNK